MTAFARAFSGTASGPRSGRLAPALLCLPLAACNGVLDPKGPVGRGDAAILIDAMLIMLAVVVPTILLAFWIAWHYRASNTKATYLPAWSYSGRIEAVVWSIPILVIMFIGGVIWIGSYELDPFKPLQTRTKPVEVQVVALDWKWLFIYPDAKIATVNQLTIPAGVPVHFSITSASVFNTFFIPQLGSMIYAMPGMTSQLHLQADTSGMFTGESAHFSGDGFSDMMFQVHSVPSADYGKWIASVQANGPALDQRTYVALSRQSHNVKPFTFRAVDDGLFDNIVHQKFGSAPGPEPENPAHAGREATEAGRR